MTCRVGCPLDIIKDNRGYARFRPNPAPVARARHTCLHVWQVWRSHVLCGGRKLPSSGTCPIGLRGVRRANQAGSPVEHTLLTKAGSCAPEDHSGGAGCMVRPQNWDKLCVTLWIWLQHNANNAVERTLPRGWCLHSRLRCLRRAQLDCQTCPRQPPVRTCCSAATQVSLPSTRPMSCL